MSCFITCESGWHYWQKPFARKAKCCCQGINDPRPKLARPFHQCCSGEHWWRSEEKALQCCDTHVRVWEDVKNPWFKDALGEQWQGERRLVLVPLTDLAKMDEKATLSYRLLNPKLV